MDSRRFDLPLPASGTRLRCYAPAVPHGHLEMADAFLILTIVIVITFVTEAGSCTSTQSIDHWPLTRLSDTFSAPPLPRTARVRLPSSRHAGTGASRRPRPSRIAELAPLVEIRLSAHIKKSVDRAASAQNLAAGPVDGAAVQSGPARCGSTSPSQGLPIVLK